MKKDVLNTIHEIEERFPEFFDSREKRKNYLAK